MIKLTRPVRRETSARYGSRALIVELQPPCIVRVREKGRQKWFELPVDAIYTLAVKAAVNAERKEKKKRKSKRR